MTDITTLQALRERVQNTPAPDADLEAALCIAFQYVPFDDKAQNVRLAEDDGWLDYEVGDDPCTDTLPPLTSSLTRTVELLRRLLPGFWWSCGLCGLTGHASIGPDYNGPIGDHLRRKWPEERFHSGFDSDLAPGDGVHRACLALLDTILAAKIAEMELAR